MQRVLNRRSLEDRSGHPGKVGGRAPEPAWGDWNGVPFLFGGASESRQQAGTCDSGDMRTCPTGLCSFPTTGTARRLPWPYWPGKDHHQSMVTLRIALEARLADGHRHKCASKDITPLGARTPSVIPGQVLSTVPSSAPRRPFRALGSPAPRERGLLACSSSAGALAFGLVSRQATNAPAADPFAWPDPAHP